MVEKRVDKRVQRTKRLVREALVALMAKKPVEKVTTTELCAKADINRNTFYAHYSSPEDVLAEIEEQLVDDVTKLVVRGYEEGNMTLVVCRGISDSQSLVRSIWHGCPRLISQAVDLFCEKNLALWSAEGLDDFNEGVLFLRFAALGSLGIVETWLDAGCKQAPEEVASLIDRFVLKGKGGLDSQRVG